MKTYLAGPMSGYVDHNFPAFDAAAARLRAEGHKVFSPAENDREMLKHGEELSYRSCLEYDLVWLCRHAEAIALLPGWEKSKGARAEYATAYALGLHIIELGDEYTK